MDEVYYSPEKYNLVIVGTLDEENLSYEFNMLCVWHHTPTGRVYYGQDSGCSCPSPFEGYYSTNGDPGATGLDQVTDETWIAFKSAVDDFPADAADKVELLAKVNALLGSQNDRPMNTDTGHDEVSVYAVELPGRFIRWSGRCECGTKFTNDGNFHPTASAAFTSWAGHRRQVLGS
jgi:hypothetical protein